MMSSVFSDFQTKRKKLKRFTNKSNDPSSFLQLNHSESWTAKYMFVYNLHTLNKGDVNQTDRTHGTFQTRLRLSTGQCAANNSWYQTSLQ